MIKGHSYVLLLNLLTRSFIFYMAYKRLSADYLLTYMHLMYSMSILKTGILVNYYLPMEDINWGKVP